MVLMMAEGFQINPLGIFFTLSESCEDTFPMPFQPQKSVLKQSAEITLLGF
jgi:hypothetical protein